MKKVSLLILIGLMFTAVSLSATSPRSQSINGATGLITTPTAFTGWGKSDFGVDVGHTFLNDDRGTHIPKITFQLLQKLELGVAYDLQDRHDKDEDLLIHGKFKFHDDKSTALAIGGNIQLLDHRSDHSWNAQQIYLAATYMSTFLKMPAETTMVFGKSFGSDGYGKRDIDFSMGFDLQLLPSIFKGHVHWISDFANYSYSAEPVGAWPWRGIFNTGARLALLKNHAKFKFNVDFVFTDVLDRNRDFGLGFCLGAKF